MVGLDSTNDGAEILFAGRCILEYQTLLHGSAVSQHAMHGKRGEQPTFYAVVAEHLFVADIILIGTWLAIDDDAKHILNGVAMAVERRALQLVAIGHAVLLPFLVQFIEGQLIIGPERIDNPDVLVKYLSWFHDCKDNDSFQETSMAIE